MKRVVQSVNCGADCFTDHIVKKMWELSNRDSKAVSIKKRARSLTANSNKQTIRNIYRYVIDKVPYKSDPKGMEYIVAPIHLEEGRRYGGDCDCMVTLMTSLLTAAGVPSRIVTIAWRKPQYTHVVLEAKQNGKWIILDPTRAENGYGRTVAKNKIRRTKKYENPMDIVSLEDNIKALSDCGCGNHSTLNDCGGKCGCRKCRSKNRAKNNNVNTNNVIIGNEFLHRLGISGGQQQPRQNRIIDDGGEVKKVVGLNRKQDRTKLNKVLYTVPDRPFY